MNAPLRAPTSRRWLTFAIAAFLTFTGLTLLSASARAASGSSLETVNLCITKSGPTKGAVRFVPGTKCKTGEQHIQVMTKAGQGVLGVQESSGAQGAAGAAGQPGAQGAVGDAGPKGETGDTGPQGLKGDTGNAGPAGPKGDTGNAGPPAPRATPAARA